VRAAPSVPGKEHGAARGHAGGDPRRGRGQYSRDRSREVSSATPPAASWQDASQASAPALPWVRPRVPRGPGQSLRHEGDGGVAACEGIPGWRVAGGASRSSGMGLVIIGELQGTRPAAQDWRKADRALGPAPPRCCLRGPIQACLQMVTAWCRPRRGETVARCGPRAPGKPRKVRGAGDCQEIDDAAPAVQSRLNAGAASKSISRILTAASRIMPALGGLAEERLGMFWAIFFKRGRRACGGDGAAACDAP
jgi:hypothetical protein